MIRNIHFVLCLLMMLLACEAVIAAERSEFRYQAGIESGREFETPVRLTLSYEIMAETTHNFADLRLFDDSGKEIPYVIYKQRLPVQEPQQIAWNVVEYHDADGTQTILLQRQGKEGTIRNLELNTAARDFEKVIEVYASANRLSWQLLATGEVFDFSSHVDLRKTSLDLPDTNAEYLQVVLKNIVPAVESQENLRLRYKDLEFAVEGPQTGAIKIESFVSHIARTKQRNVRFDEVLLSKPATARDQDGNTLVQLGRVNLPLERVTLKIQNAYFYRRIELWTATMDDDSAYTFDGSGIVYKIPGIRAVQNILTLNQPQQTYVRLKIINHDNPPLQVEQVKIEWARRNLYFIPEQGRRYTLYCSANNLPAPQYEVRNLIPDRFETLLRYPEWNLTPLQKNDTYLPKAEEQPQIAFDKHLLTGLIILIVLGLAFWTFQLMKKIPGDKKS